MSEIDYRTDIPKHYIRRECWLPACQRRKSAIKRHRDKYPLRYFTFCAAEAIDVFMLERAGVLRRSDNTGRLESVFFCEKEPEDFSTIAGLIGSPEQGFFGSFDEIVLFEDTAETAGKKLYDSEDEDYTEEVRNKLKLKDAHQRLRNAFPFDIVNLDVYGAMFPRKEIVVTRLLQSILQILRWQYDAMYVDEKCKEKFNEFTLFLTSHISARVTNPEATEQLITIVQDNIESCPEFAEAFLKRYGHIDASRLSQQQFDEFFCISLPKFIIDRSLSDIGWDVEYGPIYLYDRHDKHNPTSVYQMMHSVATCKRLPDPKTRLTGRATTRYFQAVARIVAQSINRLPNELDDNVEESLVGDLESIVTFRDQDRST